MKRLSLLLAVCVLVFTGCEHSITETQVAPSLNVSNQQVNESGGFLFPQGTAAWVVEDEGDTPFIRFRLPETHRLLAKVAEGVPGQAGQMMRAAGGDITCTCTEGSGGCSPFCGSGPGGTVCGCALDANCTTCIAEQSQGMHTGSGDPPVLFEETAIIDLKAGVSFVVTEEERLGLRCASSVLFDDPEILAAVQQYMEMHQMHKVEEARAAKSRADLPDPYIMAPLNVYGNMVWVPVEKGTSISVALSEVVWNAQKGIIGESSCTCDSGGGGCTYKKRGVPGIGWVEWCEAENCSVCTLHNG